MFMLLPITGREEELGELLFALSFLLFAAIVFHRGNRRLVVTTSYVGFVAALYVFAGIAGTALWFTETSFRSGGKLVQWSVKEIPQAVATKNYPLIRHMLDSTVGQPNGDAVIAAAFQAAVAQGDATLVDALSRAGYKNPGGEEAAVQLMFQAIENDDLATVVTLLESGNDVNQTNARGESALFAAVREENLAAVLLLLKYGADVHETDRSGNTPRSYARKPEIEQVLAVAEAKR